jgi:putative methyltransferase (TIGR04325 family)
MTRKYDLVISSSSLQYTECWQEVVRKLVCISGKFLFITRLPVVYREKSFVVLQRPYHHGYHTEYRGWFINYHELMDCITSYGAELVREFLVDEHPYVYNAPEQCRYTGLLFKIKD